MSKRKFVASRDIPKAIKKIHSLSPTELSKHLSNEFNEEIKPNSIFMWLNRNPSDKEKLGKEVFKDKANKMDSSKTDNESKLINIQEFRPIEEHNKVPQTQEINISNKIRVPARNRVKLISKEKLLKIKLNLNEYKNIKEAIRYALDNYYRWTKYNITEMREYIKGLKEKVYSSPECFKSLENKVEYYNPFRTDTYFENSVYENWIDELSEAIKSRNGDITRKIAYEISINVIYINKEQYIYLKEHLFKIKNEYYYIPEWLKYFEKLLDLWEISRTSALRKAYLTIKELYEKIEIDVPEILETEKNVVIENLADLERTGIFEDLDYKIKSNFKIEDSLEYAHNNWSTLDKMEKMEIISLITTEKKQLINHPYYVLIQEDKKRDDLINREIK